MHISQSFKRAIVPIAATFALAGAHDASAAVDAFLKIDGIQGESQDSKHKDEIEVLSWSWGGTQGSHGLGSGAGARASRPCIKDFTITKFVDKASPTLAAATVTGTLLPKAVLTVRKAGGTQQEYLTFELKSVLVSSYSTGGVSSGEGAPTEQVSLNFSSLSYEYKPQKDDGSVGAPVRAMINGGCNA